MSDDKESAEPNSSHPLPPQEVRSRSAIIASHRETIGRDEFLQLRLPTAGILNNAEMEKFLEGLREDTSPNYGPGGTHQSSNGVPGPDTNSVLSTELEGSSEGPIDINKEPEVLHVVGQGEVGVAVMSSAEGEGGKEGEGVKEGEKETEDETKNNEVIMKEEEAEEDEVKEGGAEEGEPKEEEAEKEGGGEVGSKTKSKKFWAYGLKFFKRRNK